MTRRLPPIIIRRAPMNDEEESHFSKQDCHYCVFHFDNGCEFKYISPDSMVGTDCNLGWFETRSPTERVPVDKNNAIVAAQPIRPIDPPDPQDWLTVRKEAQ